MLQKFMLRSMLLRADEGGAEAAKLKKQTLDFCDRFSSIYWNGADKK